MLAPLAEDGSLFIVTSSRAGYSKSSRLEGRDVASVVVTFVWRWIRSVEATTSSSVGPAADHTRSPARRSTRRAVSRRGRSPVSCPQT